MYQARGKYSQALGANGFTGATASASTSSAPFANEISALNRMANEIESAKLEPQITVAKGKELIGLAIKAGSPLTDRAIEMSRQLSNIFVTDQIVLAANSVFNGLQSNVHPLLLIVRRASDSGQALIPSAPFQRGLVNQIRAIVRGYETLQFLEEIKPSVVRFLGATLDVVAKIGRALQTVLEFVSAPFVAAAEIADNLGKAAGKGMDIVKWLTLGGLAFTVYWFGIRKS